MPTFVSNIRLLESDEWRNLPFIASIGYGYSQISPTTSDHSLANLYYRTEVSQKPELLLERAEISTSPAITFKDPSFFTKIDREKNVVITLKNHR